MELMDIHFCKDFALKFLIVIVFLTDYHNLHEPVLDGDKRRGTEGLAVGYSNESDGILTLHIRRRWALPCIHLSTKGSLSDHLTPSFMPTLIHVVLRRCMF